MSGKKIRDRICLFCLAIMGVMSIGNAGENRTYDGTSGLLQATPTWAEGTGSGTTSFFPVASTTGNTITVDYTSGLNPYRVFGGLSDTASVSGNSVILKQITPGQYIANNVYGGFTIGTGASADNNNVEISGSSIDAWNIVGGYSKNGDAESNTVTMSSGLVNGIWGADTTGNATNNVIEFSGGKVNTRITGGYTSGGNATRNQIIISGGTIGGIVSGGHTGGVGDVDWNEVVISSGTIDGNIYGGYSNGSGSADHNTVSVSSGNMGGSVLGGRALTGSASTNMVVLTGGTISAANMMIAGGSVETTGNVFDNTVSISNITGSDTLSLRGGTTVAGTAHQNRVSVENATFGTATAGESFNGGDASSNTLSAVNVTGQTLSGGLAAVGAAFDNTVNFHSGTIGDGVGGYIYGGNGQSEIYGNTVNIYGGTMGQGVSQPVSATVLGGFGGSANGDVHDNRVNVYDGVIGASGSNAYIYGGESSGNGANVYNNIVTLAGGTVGSGAVVGEIYGGRQSGASGDANNNTVVMTGGETDSIYGGRSFNGEAIENKIELSGGTVNSWVIGGYTPVESSGNIVSLSGTANLVNAQLRGWEGGAAVHSGNTLEIHQYNGTAVKSIGNFEIYDFLIPTSLANGGAALIVTDASDISNSETRVAFVDGGSMLQTNDRITLINDEAGLTTTNVTPGAQQIKQGALIVYDFDLLTDPKNLYLHIRSISADPSSKSVSEGRIGSLAFLNQGHDLIVEKGFDAADAVLSRTGDGWSKPTFFGVVGGGHFRHKTGSHVDVDGVSTLLGLTWRNNGPNGTLLLGAFFESGYANYDTRNAFASGTVRGDGDSRYFGGGLLARYNWKSGFYVESTGRVGGVKNKFDSDLTDAFGNRARYDINSTYFGLHAGVGYKWQLNEKVLLDLSTKYLWSRQNSDTAVITGSRVSFDANDSHRWRTGARFTYTISDCIAPYVGAAFEYEFNGEAKAGIHNIRFGVPSLKGGTGVGEIGLAVRRGAFTADLGVQGHIGRRDGITGSLRVGLNF